MIADAEARVCLAPRTNLESVLARALEEQCEAVEVGVCAGAPVAGWELCPGDVVVVQQAQGRLGVGFRHEVRLVEEVGGKPECGREDAENLHRQRVALLHEPRAGRGKPCWGVGGGRPAGAVLSVVLELD